LKSLDHTKLHTHTHIRNGPSIAVISSSHRPLHNTQHTLQTNIHILSGILTSHCRNQGATTYALHCMTTGIGRYIFI